MNKDLVSKVRELYKKNSIVSKILDYFASRERSPSSSKVDRLAWVTDLSRADVISAFKELARLGVGEFIVGRRGQKSRFEWKFAAISVGQAASGEDVEIEEQFDGVDEDTDSVPQGSSDSVEHSFLIRPGFNARVLLPGNLTKTEAERLASFVRALPFEG